MLTVRPVREEDAPALGRICYEAFTAIAGAHNFPPDFPNAEFATGLMKMMIGSERTFGVVAEVDGRIAGSNFMSADDAIFGIGPITIDPEVQNKGAGATLMRAVMAHAQEKRAAGVRQCPTSPHPWHGLHAAECAWRVLALPVTGLWFVPPCTKIHYRGVDMSKPRPQTCGH